jgi:hypothetical protein
MLAEPIFNFTEELAKPSRSTSSSNNANNSNNSSSLASGSVGVSGTQASSTGVVPRVSLKRPSKLELAVNLNDQLTYPGGAGLSSFTSPASTALSHAYCGSANNSNSDKNNNSLNGSNSITGGAAYNASSSLFTLSINLLEQQVCTLFSYFQTYEYMFIDFLFQFIRVR